MVPPAAAVAAPPRTDSPGTTTPPRSSPDRAAHAPVQNPLKRSPSSPPPSPRHPSPAANPALTATVTTPTRGTSPKSTSPTPSTSAVSPVNSPSSSSPVATHTSSPVQTSSPSQQQAQSSSSPSQAQGVSRRVKLYRLSEDEWIDLGTGNCVGHFVDSGPSTVVISETKTVTLEDGAWILVTQEADKAKNLEAELILKSRIKPYPPGYLSDEEDEEDLDEAARNGRVQDIGGYMRQQETLVVWTEEDSDLEMALSFATTTGCAEIWEFIKAARKWSNHPLTSPSISPSLSSPQHLPMYALSHARLPEPTLGNIAQIEHAIRNFAKTAVGRERTAAAITSGGYIQKLILIHQDAEDLESLSDLHALCRVMQSILLLNDNTIFDLILRDDIILGVASILEYDPEFPTMKASYRAHLADSSHFTQVVPIRSPSLLSKIHQTHRLHYLKDVVLARVIEDSTFSMLNSAIYFNEVDIVNEVATDQVLLKELFAIFDDDVESPSKSTLSRGKKLGKEGAIGPQAMPPILPKAPIGPQLPLHLAAAFSSSSSSFDSLDKDSTSLTVSPTLSEASTATIKVVPPHERKRNAILFLQQLCSMAKNLQLPARTAFFRSLADRGLLHVLEVSFSLPLSSTLPIPFTSPPASPSSAPVATSDSQMRSATIEILMLLVDHDPSNVRGYSVKQHAAGKRPLVNFLIELFHQEEDLGLKQQMAEALRVLVDAGGDGGPLEAPPRLRQEDPDAEKFLQYFYDECIVGLLTPILKLPQRNSGSPFLDLPVHYVALCTHLCDLLCFFISHHTFRSKYFVLSSSISSCVSRLVYARHKPLQLAGLRYFRACIGKNDDFYNRFLIKNDLIVPLVDMIWRERDKDNLVRSACLEFFEFVRTVNAKAIIHHLVDRHGERVRELGKNLDTFRNIVVKWEQNNEPPPAVTNDDSAAGKGLGGLSGATSKSMTRERRSWTRMDMDEESYFNTPDDEEEDPPLLIASVDSTATSSSTTNLSPTTRKRVSDSLSEDESRKKVRFQNGSPSPAMEGVKPLPRSKTWPSFESDKKRLVDYGDDEEEEEDPSLAGGFIREKQPFENGGGPLKLSPAFSLLPSPVLAPMNGGGPKGGVSLTMDNNSATTIVSAPTAALVSKDVVEDVEPPSFKRRRSSMEDDDDDTLGLISKGKKVAPSHPKAIGLGGTLGGGGGGLSVGGMGVKKISFGSSFAKLVGGEKEKEKQEEKATGLIKVGGSVSAESKEEGKESPESAGIGDRARSE